LNCGDYFLTGDLYVASGSKIRVDTSCGPVRLYLSGSANLDGPVVSANGVDDGQVLLYSWGPSVRIAARAIANIAAPAGQVVIDVPGATFSGAAYGRWVEVHQQMLVTHIPFVHECAP